MDLYNLYDYREILKLWLVKNFRIKPSHVIKSLQTSHSQGTSAGNTTFKIFEILGNTALSFPPPHKTIKMFDFNTIWLSKMKYLRQNLFSKLASWHIKELSNFTLSFEFIRDTVWSMPWWMGERGKGPKFEEKKIFKKTPC